MQVIKKFRVLIAVSLLFLTTLAMADTMGTLMVGGPVTGTTLTIKDSALTALNSNWANGATAYIDPYHGTLNGQSVLLFCIDPNHLDNNNPLGYAANISPNGTGSNTLQALNLVGSVLPTSNQLSLAAKNAGFTNADQLYGGLAWLSQQLQGTTVTVDQQKYQAAIWQLRDYTNTFSVVNAPYSGDLIGIEHDAMMNSLTSGFSVLTDANEKLNGVHAGQEYIILTPEPGSSPNRGNRKNFYVGMCARSPCFRVNLWHAITPNQALNGALDGFARKKKPLNCYRFSTLATNRFPQESVRRLNTSFPGCLNRSADLVL